MINTEIIAAHLDTSGIELEKYKGYCKICGKKITEAVPEKKAISSNFTNFSECAHKQSKYICKECTACLKEAALRKNNFIADKNNLYLLKKNDLENYLFNLEKYISGPFVVGITLSFKKHNSFRCSVNYNTKRFYIRQEDKEYLFDAVALKPVYDMLNEAYLQFSKEEIKTGNYRIIATEQFGIDKLSQYEAIFKQYRGSAQFELLCYMLNSERRNEYIKEKQRLEKEAKKKCKKSEKSKKQNKTSDTQQLQLF